LALVIALPISVATDHFWRSQGMPQGVGFGVAPNRFPIRAMAFVRAQGLPTPVIASLGDGGYILHVEGEKSVFVDGRLEVYGQATLEAALLAMVDRDGFRSILEKHEIKTALLSIPYLRGAISDLEQRPDWIPVYYDDDYVLYVRLTSETRPLIERLAIDWESPVRHEVTPDPFFTPSDWLAGFVPRAPNTTGLGNLGDLFILVKNLHEARKAFREAVALRPGDGHSWLHVFLLEETLGDPDAAERALHHVAAGVLEQKNVARVRASLRRTRTAQCRVLTRRYAREPVAIGRDPERRFDVGACFEHLGDTERAIDTWKALLIPAPNFAKARAGIERLATPAR
jgi:tetratricopeptide (TPR) repeat protein